eukprot:scaffold77225_cov19-Tisochrysis_lutea.AAC.1
MSSNIVEEIPESIGVVVALGKFDAMHLGHRALAMKVSTKAISWNTLVCYVLMRLCNRVLGTGNKDEQLLGYRCLMHAVVF